MDITLMDEFEDIGEIGTTHWYEVKLRIQSNPDTISEIDRVEYFLEDTSVSNPVIVSGNSYNNNFEVRTKTWKNNFPITAKVTFKNPGLSPMLLKSN